MFALVAPSTQTLSLSRPLVAVAAYDPRVAQTSASQNGRLLATCDYDGVIKLWTVTGRRATFQDCLRVTGPSLDGSPASLQIALSPNGRELGISSQAGVVAVWSLPNLKKRFSCVVSTQIAADMQFTADGSKLLYSAGGANGLVDLPSGKMVATPIQLPFAQLPGAERVVTTSGLFDLVKNREIRAWRSKVPSVEPVAVSPDGRLALVGGEDPTWVAPTTAVTEAAYARTQTLRTWRISDGKLMKTFPGLSAQSATKQDLRWTSNRAVEIGDLGETRNVLSGRIVSRLTPADASSPPAGLNPFVTTHGVRFYRFSAVELPIHKAAAATPHLLSLLVDAPHPRRGVRYLGSDSVLTISNGTKLKTIVRNVDPPGGGFDFRNGQPLILSDWFATHPGGVEIQHRSAALIEGRPQYTVTEHDLAENETPVVRTLTTDSPSLDARGKGRTRPMHFGQALVDGQRAYLISSGPTTGSIQCIDLESGKTVWNKERLTGWLNSTSLSSGPHSVAFSITSYSQHHSTLLVLDSATGAEQVDRVAPRFTQSVLSADGSRLAATGSGGTGWFSLGERDATWHPVQGSSRAEGGDLLDGSIFWVGSSGKLVVVNSARPLEIDDCVTNRLIGTVHLFRTGEWLVVAAGGRVDGSPNLTHLAKVFQNGAWKPARREAGLLLHLLG